MARALNVDLTQGWLPEGGRGRSVQSSLCSVNIAHNLLGIPPQKLTPLVGLGGAAHPPSVWLGGG